MSSLVLTLYEMVYIGVVLGKPVQAIPDYYGELPKDNASEFRQAVMDSLLAKGLVCMDFDGELSVSTTVLKKLDICINCDGYYLVNIQKTDGTQVEEIIWRKKQEFLRASIHGYECIFSTVSADDIRNAIRRVIDVGSNVTIERETVQLSQFVLKKAKRAIDQNDNKMAINILRQSGAGDSLLADILYALAGNANLITMAYVELEGRAAPVTHLISEGKCSYILISPVVNNFRSAAIFAQINAQSLQEQLNAEIDKFISRNG